MFQNNTTQPYYNFCFAAILLFSISTESKNCQKETSETYSLCIKESDGLGLRHFQAVYLNNNPVVEDLLTLNIPLQNTDNGRGTKTENVPGEVCRKNNGRLLRYNNHICYGRNNNSVFQSFRCCKCDFL